jgi:hypothetical protein
MFTSCSGDDNTTIINNGGGGGSVSNTSLVFKAAKANNTDITGAKAVAVGRKLGGNSASAKDMTRAEGDVKIINSLLKASDDMKFIEVKYTFDVEVAVKDENGKEEDIDKASEEQKKEVKTIIERVNSSMRIVPNFIFNVGDNYLWLSNCRYEVPDYDQMEESPVKKILTTIRDDYNDSHRSTHGGQYFIRKSDGTLVT